MDRSVEDIRKEAKEAYGFVPGFVDIMLFEQPAADILWTISRHSTTKKPTYP